MGLEWLAGVALSVVGNILINLGTNLLKHGHNRRMHQLATHPAYKDRAWQIGFSLYACGNFASFFSFGYAAQSILAAIGCIQFVSNVVFASLFLKEKATCHIMGATGLIVAGCVLLVVFGSHRSEVLDVNQLLQLYQSAGYIAYLLVGGATVAATYVAYWFGRRAIRLGHGKQTCWLAVLPVMYSVFSALICTQSLLFNKAIMVLWRMTLAGDNQFNRWFTWLMALAFIVTAGLWVVQLDKGLQVFPALVIVPCLQLCWTLFGVISGMLYFQEYISMTQLQQAMFVVGVVVVCFGAGVLASAPQVPKQDVDIKEAGSHHDVDVVVITCTLEPLVAAGIVRSKSHVVQPACDGGGGMEQVGLSDSSGSLKLWPTCNHGSRGQQVHTGIEGPGNLSDAAVLSSGATASNEAGCKQGSGLLPSVSLDRDKTYMTRRSPPGISRLRTCSVPE